MGMSRIFGYGRKSTDDQTTEQQLMVIRNAGYDVQDSRWITDSISGGVVAMERPAFKNLVENKLESGDTLVISKLDRLGRDNIDVQNVVNMLAGENGMGIRLVILDMPVKDMSSAEGRLMLQMFSAFAEFEKNRISERTKEALAKKKDNGDQLGRPAKRVFEQVQELKSGGMSQNKIAVELGVSLSTVRRNWIQDPEKLREEKRKELRKKK
ncbi:recombinase family protein [Vibrio vulnificus]|nr:recombinase family protein [Vibrio parahaemolyticus]EHY8553045.1 recombinase family protein [Vibrio parahaemolyticus]EIA9327224.1 recombinase family protein [Vibrio parahaemolyticus]EJV9414067.1 recombinase family protein [Vibrio vulnificus]